VNKASTLGESFLEVFCGQSLSADDFDNRDEGDDDDDDDDSSCLTEDYPCFSSGGSTVLVSGRWYVRIPYYFWVFPQTTI
jgi:hypothetical protein